MAAYPGDGYAACQHSAETWVRAAPRLQEALAKRCAPSGQQLPIKQETQGIY